MSKLLQPTARFISTFSKTAVLLLIIGGALLVTTIASGSRFQWWRLDYWTSFQPTNKNTYEQPWVLPAEIFGVYLLSLIMVKFNKWRAGKK